MALSRREALVRAGGITAGLLLTGCGGVRAPSAPGSTLLRSLTDPDGDGLLQTGPALPLRDRTELASRAKTGAVLATVAQVSDLHIRDAQSPGRVAFLDRVGPRLGSAFRPHETLTVQTLTATVEAINAARPQAVLVTGDLVDTAQQNELAWALGILHGGRVRPDSGGRGYQGVQQADNPDPSYYRPSVDPPVHGDLLRRAVQPVRSPGLQAPWFPALGNHDVLVAGEIAPSTATRAVATGGRLLVSPGPKLLETVRGAAPTRATVERLLGSGLDGRALRVTPDPARTQLDAADVVGRLRRGSTGRLDYAVSASDALRVIVLDLVRRDAGSGGLVTAETLAALQRELAAAGNRHVLVAVHQPLESTAGGEAILDVLDADPRVVAVIAGHTHRNAIEPRRTATGGYWLITTASIVDWPQQWRVLRLVETAGGGTALETWMVDHTGRTGDEGSLAGIARDLAFLDAQGGRPSGAAGPAAARNVRLHLPARAPRPPRVPGLPRALPDPAAPSELGAGDVVLR